MQKLSLVLSSALVAVGLGTSVHAQDKTVDLRDYLIGISPLAGKDATPKSGDTIEKASALNGTLYAVLAPTYNGTGGTLSYIRLFNGGSAGSNFTISVVGSPTGRIYGSATISVPRSASPQYDLNQILSLAGAGALNGGDTSYSLYIQNIEPASGYQHVIYNATNRFFENVSVCKSLLNQAIATVSNTSVLTNVHTTRIPTHPSRVQIHNFWNAPVSYRITLIDSVTGAVVGSPVTVATAANASYDMPFSDLQTQAGWTPTESQFHANVFVTDPTGAPPYQVLGQSIFNEQLSANINMSTACAVNDSTSNGGGYSGGGGLNGY